MDHDKNDDDDDNNNDDDDQSVTVNVMTSGVVSSRMCVSKRWTF